MDFENTENMAEESGGRVIHVDVTKEMRKSFLDYSMSVIVQRALRPTPAGCTGRPEACAQAYPLYHV